MEDMIMTPEVFVKFASLGFCAGFSIGCLTLLCHLVRRGLMGVFRLPKAA